MRLFIARCSVDYEGRLTAHLPPRTDSILAKSDGSVSIHADDRAYKPLNWMSPPCRTTRTPTNWVSEPGRSSPAKTGDQLVITIEEVLHDSFHELGVDPGLQKDGVEAHLQALLATHIQTLGEGWTLVRREYGTAIGPVDLLARDGSEQPSRSRSSVGETSTVSNNSLGTSICSIGTRDLRPSAESLRLKRSSPRQRSSPRTEGSDASPSTTTASVAGSTRA